jgi:hypothetical protein
MLVMDEAMVTVKMMNDKRKLEVGVDKVRIE